MHVAELWRYPVKSLRGELLQEAEVLADRHSGRPRDRGGLEVASAGDHLAHPSSPAGTCRAVFRPRPARPRSTAFRGTVRKLWHWLRRPSAKRCGWCMSRSTERFDVLPLLVATDGAIQAIGLDRRRFRPNILIGGVDGLAERQWEGKRDPHRRGRNSRRAASGALRDDHLRSRYAEAGPQRAVSHREGIRWNHGAGLLGAEAGNDSSGRCCDGQALGTRIIAKRNSRPVRRLLWHYPNF